MAVDLDCRRHSLSLYWVLQVVWLVVAAGWVPVTRVLEHVVGLATEHRLAEVRHLHFTKEGCYSVPQVRLVG